MVLPLPPIDGPGGMLYFEYADVAAGERHSLRLHVAQFDQAPVGGVNDYRYTGVGPVSPSESGVLATFAAVGALWAAYYPAEWTFSLVDVWFNAGGRLTRLDVVPTAAPIVGVSAEAEPAGVVQKRIFRVVGPDKSARRIYFSQVPGAQTWQNTPVSPTAGGVDARDRAVMAYLAGGGGGVVSGEGRRFLPEARLRVQWARRLAPAAGTGPPGPPGPVGPPGPAGTGGTGAALDCDPCAAITTIPTITPTPGVDAGLSRCAAAAEVAAWLEEYYAHIRTWMNAGVTTGAAFSVARIVDGLVAIFFALAQLPPIGIQVLTLGQIARLLWLHSTHLELFPALTADDKTAIQRAVYCALPAGSPMGPVTNATKSQIVANLHKVESSFAYLSGALVALLANVPSVAQYQELAYIGGQDTSDACALWDCGSHSFTGGAQYGVALGRSFTGGVQFGVALRRSMTGGAQFGLRLTRSMTGGAKTA